VAGAGSAAGGRHGLCSVSNRCVLPWWRSSRAFPDFARRRKRCGCPAQPKAPHSRGLSRVRARRRRDSTSLPLFPELQEPPGRAGGAAFRSSKSAETRRVEFLFMPSGAVLKGRGSPLQTKSAGLPGPPGITRKRAGLPLKIFDQTLSSSSLLLLHSTCSELNLTSPQLMSTLAARRRRRRRGSLSLQERPKEERTCPVG